MRCVAVLASLFSLQVGISDACAQQPDTIPDITEDKIDQEYAPKAVLESFKIDREATSLSPSKVFLVAGKLPNLRRSVAKGADQLFIDLCRQLGIDPKKTLKVPIRIRLIDGGEKAVGSPYRITYGNKPEGGLYVQLAVDTSRFERDSYRRVLLEVITYAFALGELENLEESTKLVAHPWFIDGMLELLNWQSGGAISNDYLELSKTPKLFDLSKIFSVTAGSYRKMSEGEKRKYRAASGALMMALTSQKDGKNSIREMLKEVGLFGGEKNNLLKKHFPEVNKSKNGIRVSWLLQLSLMSVPKLSDVMNMLDTESELENALTFSVPDDDGQMVYSISNYEEILKFDEPVKRALIDLASRKLVQLDKRCFPDYRPMLVAYGNILNSLSEGKSKGVKETLKGLAEERKLMKRAALRTRDYLDWYEVNFSRKVSRDYSNLSDKQSQSNEEATKMGKYLTILDQLYQSTEK